MTQLQRIALHTFNATAAVCAAVVVFTTAAALVLTILHHALPGGY